MGLRQAVAGAVGGVLADQWKDFYTVPAGLPATAALFAAVPQGTNAGRGSNTRGSNNIISNGSKIVVPEGYGLLLFQDGKYTYMVTAQGKQVYLSDNMEGVKFALQCRCGKPHVRFAALHSIEAEYDLCCQWCECEQSSWTGSGKDPVSKDEKAAMEALQSAGLDHTTACQVRLPFWKGRVDFYHVPSKTVTQADGSSHFVRMH